MRLRIEGKHTGLAPHLMGWIADHLEALNTSYEDIHEARVTFTRKNHQEVAAVELILTEKTLRVTRRGATRDIAIQAAMHMTQQALQDARAARRQSGATPSVQQATLQSYPLWAVS
jgi:ribosome-associated translation inhibitor RaiA